ncbi:MAG: NAD(P)-binding protein [Bacillota bacterium]
MDKKIPIIGAGMAGLSAGCHARRNGYDVEIFEMHHQPGGLCTAWERNGYTFDGCIHWLVGTRPGSQFNRLWREVGALQDVEIIDQDVFMQIEGEDGRVVNVFSSPVKPGQRKKWAALTGISPGSRTVSWSNWMNL